MRKRTWRKCNLPSKLISSYKCCCGATVIFERKKNHIFLSCHWPSPPLGHQWCSAMTTSSRLPGAGSGWQQHVSALCPRPFLHAWLPLASPISWAAGCSIIVTSQLGELSGAFWIQEMNFRMLLEEAWVLVALLLRFICTMQNIHNTALNTFLLTVNCSLFTFGKYKAGRGVCVCVMSNLAFFIPLTSNVTLSKLQHSSEPRFPCL